ncbi:MAG: nickel-dependent lactate racemase [Chloroflexota bacterium]
MGLKVKLPYGDSHLSLEVPSRNTSYSLSSKRTPGLQDDRKAIREALRNPIGVTNLNECVRKNDKVVIITTDNTRACPDDRILPVIIEELEGKISRENITIIIALGLHSPLSQEQLIDKLGSNIVKNYRVINHNPDRVTSLGLSTFGTPVEVNSEVVEADFRISTGFIEPHFFAGFSGGRKSIFPGVSSARAIRKNHSYEMINHPNVRAGVLEGNPIHEDMVEQARMANLDFIVNVLLNQEKQITHVFAGNPWLAHQQGCETERAIVEAEIDHKVDITIVTNGGAPLDCDFYQACKGIDVASQITRDGGIIIAASACPDGIGPESFRSLHASVHSPEEVLHALNSTDNSGGVGWQNQILARTQLNHTIYLLSGLKDSEASQMMVTPIHSLEEGLNKALRVLGKNAEIAIIPEGPLVIPVVKKV